MLNYDLNRVDWEQLLNYTDIHNAWCIFKTKLTSISNLHIPKIKIGNSCQPPWFSAEVFCLNKKKKLAHIVPIYKKGNKSSIENYCPVSLTCIISKIFVKSIHNALLGSCCDYNYIHNTQHGFLPQKSCTTQLVPFSHDISLGLNENKLIDVIYFDFMKAFDSVNHNIILNKLKNEFNVNRRMLKFVKEYLTV